MKGLVCLFRLTLRRVQAYREKPVFHEETLSGPGEGSLETGMGIDCVLSKPPVYVCLSKTDEIPKARVREGPMESSQMKRPTA